MEKSTTYKKTKARTRRRVAIRKHLFGSSERPRLSVFRSLNHIYAQIVDDESGRTLVSVSTVTKDLRAEIAGIKGDAQDDKKKTKLGRKVKQSYQVGMKLGEKALAAGITKIAFDRGGYKYHGRVKALADGARKAGLEF